MNWLQKISQSKPMALPFARPEWSEPGLDDIDQIMQEETAAEERKNMQPSYLGSGMFGIAVDLPNGLVGKYTDDIDEATMATYIQDNPMSCVVNIHDIKLIQEEPELFMIIMDKIKTLNDTEQAIVYNLRSFVPYAKNHLREWQVPEKVQKIRDRTSNHRVIDDFIDMEKCLKSNNISTQDTHGENIGYDKQWNLVLFDLGSSKKT